MVKRFMAIILMLCIVLPTYTVSATEPTKVGNVIFQKADGSSFTKLPRGEKIKAIANIGSHAESTLVVAIYDGYLKDIKYKNAESGKQTITIDNILVPDSDTADVRAYIINSMLEPEPKANPASVLANSTSIDAIIVDGIRIEGVNDENDLYKCIAKPNPKIEVIPTDNTTKIDVTPVPDKLPGYVTIKATSQNGDARFISLALMEDEAAWNTVRSIEYYVGETKYEVENFDPAVLEYDITLPDNTLYAGVGYTTFGDASHKLTYKNKDISNVEINGVKYAQGSFHPSSGPMSVYTSPGNVADGLKVPIKNEETTALITLAAGEGESATEKVYTLNFKSKQPRLTSFNAVGEESWGPYYIGGAGVNLDDRTFATADRTYIFDYFDQYFVGCSIIPLASRCTKNDTSYINTHSTGEYLNFTADTAGTVYVSANSDTNKQEYLDNGYIDLTIDENKPVTNMGLNRYETKDGTKKDFLIRYGKHFNAGETVSVYVPGSGKIGAVLIKWDGLEYDTDLGGDFIQNKKHVKVSLNGKEFSNFDPDCNTYDLLLYGEEYPVISAEAVTEGLWVLVDQPSHSNGGRGTVEVIGNGINEVYTFNVSLRKPGEPVNTGTPTVTGGSYYIVTAESDGSYTLECKDGKGYVTMGASGGAIVINTASTYDSYDSTNTMDVKYLWISYDASCLETHKDDLLGFVISDNKSTPAKNFKIKSGARIDYLVDLSKSTGNVDVYVNGVLNTGYTYDFPIPDTAANLKFYSRLGFATKVVGDDLMVIDNLEEKAYDGNTNIETLKGKVTSRTTSGTVSFYANPFTATTATACEVKGNITRDSVTIKSLGINSDGDSITYADFMLPGAATTNLKFVHFTTNVKTESFDGVGSFVVQTGANQIGSSIGLLGSETAKIDVIFDVANGRWHAYSNGVYLGEYINSELNDLCLRCASSGANTTNEFTFENSKYTYYYEAGNEDVTLETLQDGVETDYLLSADNTNLNSISIDDMAVNGFNADKTTHNPVVLSDMDSNNFIPTESVKCDGLDCNNKMGVE